ncbi:hypothetical protein HSBAA_10400 [Vreelandella sulfidaeris]|uniref:Shikimate kinase n=1 Tax=Vreelandella sulfidaeris TaxID=115553 RepID=A0A455U888_9GAMM|nr:hypothetical protein HSBAA_10400 [Halomonas sulfidaeris]
MTVTTPFKIAAGRIYPGFFDVEGEQGFRLREAHMIDELTRLSPVVVATGGGAVLREENRRALRERGTVVYLLTTVDQQLKRTAKIAIARFCSAITASRC